MSTTILKFIKHWQLSGIKKYSVNAIWSLSSRLFSTIVGLIVTIYLVRYLGPENFGNLSYAVSYVGLFSILGSLGVTTIVGRELIKHPENTNKLMGSAFVIQLIGGFIATLTVLISALIFTEQDVSRVVIFILAGTLILNTLQNIRAEFAAHAEIKYTAQIDILAVIILNILKLSVVILDKGVLWIGLILLFEPFLVGALLIYRRTYIYGSLREWQFQKQTAYKLLIDAWPFIFIATFSSIFSRIDQVILKQLMDSAAVGIYSAAIRISEAWLFVPGAIAGALFPAIVNASKVNIYEYKRRLLSLMFFLGALSITVATIFSFFGQFFIQLLYGHDYVASTPILNIYLLSSVSMSLYSVINLYLINENKRFTIFLLTFCTAIANIILNLVLIPVYGTIGAAFATLISYLILLLPTVQILRIK